jgi:hypothetical protein
MSREPGTAPQFDRMIFDLQRAKKLWEENNINAAERLLKLVASIAFSEYEERGENAPVPESV